jgi:lipopolysaccharide export system ATP-binding protein
MIVGLIQPMAGRILMDGEDITDMPMYRRARRGIGYLSQEPSIFRKLTVEETSSRFSKRFPSRKPSGRSAWSACSTSLGSSACARARRIRSRGRAPPPGNHAGTRDRPQVHDAGRAVRRRRSYRRARHPDDRGRAPPPRDRCPHQRPQRRATLDIVDRAYIMFDGQVKVSGTVRDLVFDDTVAEIYLGPTLTARLRARFAAAELGGAA